MNATIHILASPISEVDCQTFATLFESCFGKQPDADFSTRLNGKPGLLALLAKLDNEPVAFKIGYRKFTDVFFSWLGRVTPSKRRCGIARMLRRKQHDWCSGKGYREVQTETFGDVPEMLVLNLSEEFQVFGTYFGNDNQIRVQLRKTLAKT